MNAKITKLWQFGQEDKTAKAQDAIFAFDQDAGTRDRLPLGYATAYAFAPDGCADQIYPTLNHAQIVTVAKHGMLVRGTCEELLKGKLRRFYCEWWVAWKGSQ